MRCLLFCSLAFLAPVPPAGTPALHRLAPVPPAGTPALLAAGPPAGTPALQATPEQAIRDIIEQYHLALAAEDVPAALAVWSPSAPDIRLTKLQLETRFRADDRTTTATTILRLELVESRAQTRVARDQRITIARTGETIERTDVRQYELHLEAEVWRIWRDMSVAEAIGLAIAGAPDRAAQQRILDADREHWDLPLFQLLAQRASAAYVAMKYDAGLSLSEASLRVAEAIGDREAVSAGLYNIGNIYYLQGRYPAALESYERSRASSEASGDTEMLAQALLGLATVHYALGDYTASHQRFRERLAHVRALDDRQGIASTLTSLGDVLYWQGDYPAARTHYVEALPMLEALDHPSELARAQAGVAGVFAAQGDAAQALDYYGRAMASAKRTGDKAARARALAGMGHVFFDHGYPDRALASFGEALTNEEQLKQPEGIASVLSSMAVVHATEGRHLEAIESYTKSLQHYEAAQNPRGAAGAHLGLGLAHASMHKRAEALALYQTALDRFTALGDADGQARTWLGIGLVHLAAGDAAKPALDAAMQAIQHATKAESDFTIWRANVIAGRAHRALGRPAEARSAFEQSIRIREANRFEYGPSRQFGGLSDEGLDPYDALIDLLVSEDKLAETLSLAERARQRMVGDILGRYAVEIDRGLNADERTRERTLLADLGSLRTQYQRVKRQRTPDPARAKTLLARLTAARTAHLRLLDTLFARLPALRAARAESKPVTAPELSKLIDGRTAALQFIVVDERVVLLVAARDGASDLAAAAADSARPPAGPALLNGRAVGSAFRLRGISWIAPARLAVARADSPRAEAVQANRSSPGVRVTAHTFAIEQAALITRVLRFRDLIRTADPAAAAESQALAMALLGTALDRIRPKERLLIVPDGILWHLPFQALIAFDDRFLGATHEVVLAPSLTAHRDFARSSGATTMPASVLSFEDPLIAAATLTRVSESRKDPEPSSPAGTAAAAPATEPVTAPASVERSNTGSNAERSASTASARGEPERATASLAGATDETPRRRKADPTVEGTKPPPPPTLGEIYGAERSRIHRGADAHEARLAAEAPKHDLIHLAAPAIVDDTSALFSYIALSPGGDSGDAGVLEAWELMEIPLEGKQLLLPLASPRVSRMLAGRGMLGLAWAALVAGADTLMLSQWTVPGPSTDDVLTEWHRSAGTVSPERGMREAIQKALAREPVPPMLEWARFAVVALRR